MMYFYLKKTSDERGSPWWSTMVQHDHLAALVASLAGPRGGSAEEERGEATARQVEVGEMMGYTLAN